VGDQEWYIVQLKQSLEDYKMLAQDYKELMIEYKKLYLEASQKKIDDV
jgi:hypothetical protein